MTNYILGRRTVIVSLVVALATLLPIARVFAAGGYTWTQVTNANSAYCYALASSDTGQFLACANYGGDITTSNDYGQNWTTQTGSGSGDWYGIGMSGDGKYLAGVQSGGDLFTSSDYGVTWTDHTELGQAGWGAVAVSQSGQYMTAPLPDGLYKSSDYGTTWSVMPNGTNAQYEVSMSASGQYQLIGDTSGFLSLSSDYGQNWITPIGINSAAWYGVTVSATGQYMLAGGTSTQIYRSDDYGQTWTALPGSSGSAAWYGLHISNDGQKIIAADGTNNGALYESADGGQTFTADADLSATGWFSLASSADSSRVIIEENSGTLWLGDNPANYIAPPAATTSAASGGAQAITGGQTQARQLTDTGINVSSSVFIASILLGTGIWVYRRATVPRAKAQTRPATSVAE